MITEDKKHKFYEQIADEIRKKHDMEMLRECLAIGEEIYHIIKQKEKEQ